MRCAEAERGFLIPAGLKIRKKYLPISLTIKPREITKGYNEKHLR